MKNLFNYEITPGVGAGPFRLGMVWQELESVLPANYQIQRPRKRSLWFAIVPGVIAFYLDKKTDLVYRIGFSSGYHGKTVDGAQVGGPILENWRYVKTEDLFFFEERRGICFSADLNSPKNIGWIGIHSSQITADDLRALGSGLLEDGEDLPWGIGISPDVLQLTYNDSENGAPVFENCGKFGREITFAIKRWEHAENVTNSYRLFLEFDKSKGWVVQWNIGEIKEPDVYQEQNELMWKLATRANEAIDKHKPYNLTFFFSTRYDAIVTIK